MASLPLDVQSFTVKYLLCITEHGAAFPNVLLKPQKGPYPSTAHPLLSGCGRLCDTMVTTSWWWIDFAVKWREKECIVLHCVLRVAVMGS